MGFAAVVAILGLVFSIISIRLMSAVEGAQVVMGGAAGKRRQLLRKNGKVVSLAMSARKFLVMRIGIVFFGKLSSIIFIAEEMYPERFVEGATMAMVNTVMISSKIRKTVTRHSRAAAKKIMIKYPKKDTKTKAKSNV